MEEFFEKIKKAKLGQLVPVYKIVDAPKDQIDYFAKLSDYGKKKHCLLFESADIVEKYGETSICTAQPCLRIAGFKEEFEIKALNNQGKQLLKFMKKDFKFCDKATYKKDAIVGKLLPVRKKVSEEERLKLKTHMDILRTIAFKCKATEKPIIPFGGLFGAFSYDFIDQFEDLPQNKDEGLDDPNYEFYYVDNLVMTDHKKGKMYIIANALITHNDKKDIFNKCLKTIEQYENALTAKLPKIKKRKVVKQEITTTTDQPAYEAMVQAIKSHIIAGDVFQAVPSRTIITNYNAEPLDIYRKLRTLNPSPYMFYINNKNGILLGASPEMALRVQGEKEKIVEIRPIAGTKPRGLINGALDRDLDSRYEAELKVDEKELAEHTMLVDLARNDIAHIAVPGTRYVEEPYRVEKYSHVQHLVSTVKGTLRPDLDALHAYLASMNMGTLTGAPKVEAMKIIREIEKTARGFYGGAVGYLTPEGDFDSTIVIRSMQLKGDKAYIRVGAGIVFDSVPKNEFQETEKKAQACLKAVKSAGGFK